MKFINFSRVIYESDFVGTSELETAIHNYKSLSVDVPSKLIWAVAENYRFEPGFVEVFFVGKFKIFTYESGAPITFFPLSISLEQETSC